MYAAATLAHFAVRRTIATTLVLAAMPAAAADARFLEGGSADLPIAPFPIDGSWEWGGPETGFGDRGGTHDGEDVMADCGTPMVATHAGRVAVADSDGAAGHHLVVRGDDGDQVYMHLQRAPRFSVGDRVAAGERIGSVGRSGNASACHLHFELWTAPGWFNGGRARDPRPSLERWARAAR